MERLFEETVLVLGGAGFIGRMLVSYLLAAGYRVRVMVRGPAAALASIQNDRLEIVRGDILNETDLEAAFRNVDSVVHLAHVWGSTWNEFWRNNVEPTRKIGELCIAHNVRRLVFAGTIDSYYAGSKAGTITEKTPFDRNLKRRNYHARSKAAAEQILTEMHKQQQLPLVIVRPGIVIGPGGTLFHGAVGRFSGDLCEVWGEGTNALPLVLVSDVAAAMVRALQVDGIEGESLNLIDRPLLTARDYLDELQKQTGKPLNVVHRPIWKFFLADLIKWFVKAATRHPDRARVPYYYDWESRTQKAAFNSDHARARLGWQPASNRQRLVDEGIGSAVRYWRSSPRRGAGTRIENLETQPAGSLFEADVAIIGGGAAGLTIAREFMNTGVHVLILESGVDGESPVHAELDRLEWLNDPRGQASLNFRRMFHQKSMPWFDPDVQPYGVRCRGLGGSTVCWGGKSATFDDIDFAKRDWVPNSGWPFSRASHEPYIERAAEVLNLGPNIYDEKLWPLIGKNVKRPPLDSTKLRSFFWQFARSRLVAVSVMNLADEFRAQLAENVRTLINATVLHVDTNAEGDRVTGLQISTIDGAKSHVRAKVFVLAAGGIENARILLNSNRQQKNGLGNTYDNVGRYLMDHPGGRIGYFKKSDVKRTRYLGFYSIVPKNDSIMYMHGLALSPAVQARMKLLNTAVYVLPEISPRDPFGAVKRLLTFQTKNLGGDLWLMVCSLPLLAKGFAIKLFYSPVFPERLKRKTVNLLMAINPGFVVREFLSMRVPHRLDRMGIHVIVEQPPDRENCLVLSESTDALGVRRVAAHWRISANERRSVAAIGQFLHDELPKAGMPAPVLDEWIMQDRPDDAVLVDMAHIFGTTRMSDDPRTGVVDSQGKVHGVGNLFVAGSSIFPTSGHANPTLMILSLAIRQADEIKRRFFADTCRGAEQPQDSRKAFSSIE